MQRLRFFLADETGRFIFQIESVWFLKFEGGTATNATSSTAFCSFKRDISVECQTSKKKLTKITFISYGGVPKNGHQDRTRVFKNLYTNYREAG
jgi:hypothetical protein